MFIHDSAVDRVRARARCALAIALMGAIGGLIFGETVSTGEGA